MSLGFHGLVRRYPLAAVKGDSCADGKRSYMGVALCNSVAAQRHNLTSPRKIAMVKSYFANMDTRPNLP